MKEDVLEQILDDYLMHLGYFTRHNLKFKPAVTHVDYESRRDSVASDIDVLAIHPLKSGSDRTLVASCKAWQGGFDPVGKLVEIEQEKKVSGREAWKLFRELTKPKWSRAFVDRIEEATGSRQFTYWTVVTRLKNPEMSYQWENYAAFVDALEGNPIRIVTLATMLDDLFDMLSTTPAASEIGRAIQVMKASGWLRRTAG